MSDKPLSSIAISGNSKPSVRPDVHPGVAEPFAPDFSLINKQCAPLVLRLQTQQDRKWVEQLHAKSFGPGRFTRSAFLVREVLKLEPDLCLIGEIEGKRAGSVWMTPISLSDVPGYLLGPLAIDPDYRNQGIGGHLVKTVTAMALEKQSLGFVLLVGDAPYYQPLGYKKGKPGAVVFPGSVDPERVLVCHNRPAHAKELAGNITRR